MSDDRLALAQVAPLFAYAAGTAGGQLLFKAAALRYAADAPPGELLCCSGSCSFSVGCFWSQAEAGTYREGTGFVVRLLRKERWNCCPGRMCTW
jgi:hypothetical protein